MVSERRGTDVVRALVHVDALSVCRGVLPELQRTDESALTRARRESAVRSGWLAAEAVLEDISRPRSLALPQRPPDGVAAIVRALRVLFSPKGRQRAGASRGLRV